MFFKRDVFLYPFHQKRSKLRMSENNIQVTDEVEKEKMYFALRDEIKDNQKQENTMIVFAYTIVATILSIAFKEKVKWIALIAMVIVLPISHRIFRFRDSIAYLSSYMSVVLESKLKFKWEKDHYEYRKKYEISKSFLYIISRLDFVILSLASTASFWILNGKKQVGGHWIFTAIIIFVQTLDIIFVLFTSYKYSNVDNLKESKLKNWKELCSCESK